MILIDAKIEGKSLLLNVSAMAKVTKYCFYLLGKFWHEKILPEHFKTSAYSKYNYKPRSGKYLSDKRKSYERGLAVGDSAKQRPITPLGIPNVYTGIMRDEVLSRTNQDIRNTSRGVKIVLHGPIYLYAYRKSYGQPDKAAELTAVNNADRDAMVAFMQKHLRQEATKLTKSSAPSVRTGISG